MANAVTFTANKYYKSLASGVIANYAYKPSGGVAGVASTGAGFDFFVSLNGATATDLIPMVVKWEDRAPVQGICHAGWLVTMQGPIDFVIKDTNDTGSQCWEFL
jgi:hypothetical protein